MSATTSDYKKFIEDLMPTSLLGDAIIWIADNLEPADVFSGKQIMAAAKEQGDPDDVFSERELAEWAESNGYTKEQQ